MEFVFDHRASDSPFVEGIYRTQTDGVTAESFTSTAEYRWEMVITKYEGKTNLTIRGPETKAKNSGIPQDAEFLGIIFKLGTFMPHLPTKNFVDSEINLPVAAGQSFWFNGAAWQFPDFENADTFLNRLAKSGLIVSDPLITAALEGQSNELSLRTVQRRFVQATGLTYKAIQQIERAQKAMALLRSGVPIFDTAFELGYFDQSHLTNSLQHYMGQSPAQIFSNRIYIPD